LNSLPVLQVDVAVPGVIDKATAVVLYRDIPLSISECTGE
jgi:hypothetical protein